ncbi:hypothetical protein [Echinicola vietnamensis]|nr:hypothetical protein [Echinicola vietnamensis]
MINSFRCRIKASTWCLGAFVALLVTGGFTDQGGVYRSAELAIQPLISEWGSKTAYPKAWKGVLFIATGMGIVNINLILSH